MEPAVHHTIYVGPAGWSYPDWKGVVYPGKRTRNFNELEYISDFFNLVEVNVSYYRPVTVTMSEAWIKRVAGNAGFRFTVKLWNRFTHDRGNIESEDVRVFKEGLQPLIDHGRLGCLLLQFPWSFKASGPSRDWVHRLQEEFQAYPLVLEIRHESWGTAQVYDFLREHSIGFCNIDQPVISRSLGPTAISTSPVGYIRLHGRNYRDWFRKDAGRDARYNYLYSEEELTGWADRIRTVSSEAEETYVVANNHFLGQAVCNALQLKFMLEQKRVKVPPPLLQKFPELRKIARAPDGQGELFQQ